MHLFSKKRSQQELTTESTQKPKTKELATKHIKQTALIFILGGIIFSLAATFWDSTAGASKPFWVAWMSTVLGHLGIGSIVLGIVGILLDTNHWTDYFKKRLTDIVMDKKYLEGLASDALIDLQTAILRAYFKNNELGGEEGILKYYQQNIQDIVGDPYRSNVKCEMTIKYVDLSDRNHIAVTEKITYTCRRNKMGIQNTVSWVSEDYECLEIIGVTFRFEQTVNGKLEIEERHFPYDKID